MDGPIKGKSIMLSWKTLLDEYYRLMGWDRNTGYPLPDTLKGLGLDGPLADLQAMEAGQKG